MRFLGAGGKMGFGRGVAGDPSYTMYSIGNNFYGQLGREPITTFNGFDDELLEVDQDYTVKYVSYMFGTTMFIGSDDHLYFMGNNSSYYFSAAEGGTTTIQRVFTDAQDDGNWKTVKIGINFACGLKNDGTAWAWGANTNGQLGQGNTTSVTGGNKVQIGSGTSWTDIEPARNSSCAGISGGELYTWGRNLNGELGLGDTTQRTSPTKVGSFTNWKYVDSTEYAIICIRESGEMYSAGGNFSYNTGQGTDSGNTTTMTQIGSNSDWVDVICGYASAFASNESGELYGWGGNSFFQMGVATSPLTSPTRILSARTDFTNIRDEKGRKKIVHYNRTSLFIEDDGIYAFGFPEIFGYGFVGTTFTKVISETDWKFLECNRYLTINSVFAMK